MNDKNQASLWDLDYYNYELPAELIAQYPSHHRSSARLMNIRAQGIEDTFIKRLPQLLQRGDLLVFNNTKVLPTRFFGIKESGGKAEVFLNRILSQDEGEVWIRSSRPPPMESRIAVDDDKNVSLQVIDRREGFYIVRSASMSLMSLCRRYGQVPLPPYIKRNTSTQDRTRYQTVFAKKAGAAAAPTAGLHFSKGLFKHLITAGIERIEVTLHIGAASFVPIRSKDIRKHVMHSEWCELSAPAARILNNTKEKKCRIIAVGTTSLRVLETAYKTKFHTYQGETNLFIHPGSRAIRSADMLMTNFHLPRSSLLLLVCAFGGYESMMQAYQHAIKRRYRFFSYGDAMLIPRAH